ncbi:MAG: hypothetical protein HY356_05635 [Gammaproteobacteria bacterium]|nr:hypothetical protein [Gammaproteobacteria bacterium]
MMINIKIKYLPHHESGAALLAFMLIVITVSSFMLVSELNANIQIATGEEETRTELNLAKQALIGYAITYPDKVNSEEGPGYLPCPDTDDDGDSEGSCSSGGNTSTGRFPYETLEMEELTDSDGEHLWYILSDNFRNNPKLTPLNSDTPGELSVNGTGDIVAVIIAPGAPVSGQTRDNTALKSVANYGPNTVSNFLEDDNADLDLDFVTSAAGEFNDRLVTITRAELMSAVEKRVLGEVSQIFNDYQDNYSAFPWLSPFSNPANSAFRAQISTDREGHPPFHWSDDPSTISNVNPFTTTVSQSWDIDSDTASISISTPASVTTLGQTCLENLDCTDAIFPTLTSITASSSCTWTDRETADCTSVTFTNGPVDCDFGCGPGTGQCRRQYTVTFPEYSGTATINNPTATALRTRDVTLTGRLPTQSTAIQIIDSFRGLTPSGLCLLSHSFDNQSGRLSFDENTTGTISTSGIQYDLDVDGIDDNDDGDYADAGEVSPELPEWFVKNEWHHLVYIAYPASEAISGGATACVPGTDCLVLDGAGAPDNDKRAIAIIAGEDLTTDTTRPNGTLSDYFESENSNVVSDGIFEIRQDPDDTFNDQVKVIATSP